MQQTKTAEKYCAPSETGRIESSSIFTVRHGDILGLTFSAPLLAPVIHVERVSPEGMITLPMIGPVRAADKKGTELETEIGGRYVPRYYKALNVRISQARPDHRFSEAAEE